MNDMNFSNRIHRNFLRRVKQHQKSDAKRSCDVKFVSALGGVYTIRGKKILTAASRITPGNDSAQGVEATARSR